MAEKLALHGGQKSLEKVFQRYNSIGQEELDAVIGVMKSGVLSQFWALCTRASHFK